MSDQPIKKMMIIVSKGSFMDVYQGLVLANGALMEGIKAELFFTFNGLSAISSDSSRVPKASEQLLTSLEAESMPGISEFLDQIKEAGGIIYGCKLSIDMLKTQTKDLRRDIDGIISVGEFYERAEEDCQIIYV